ncbi:hypothetical protein JCM8097_001381 [Rhodosporidiobolus ruineniae]
MFRLTRTVQPTFRLASSSRSIHSSPSLLQRTTDSAAKAPADHSATQQQHGGSSTPKGNRTSPQASASEYNAPKDPLKDKQEAEAAEAGPAVADGQYGGGAVVEGNYTKESDEGKKHRAAAQQGEQ